MFSDARTIDYPDAIEQKSLTRAQWAVICLALHGSDWEHTENAKAAATALDSILSRETETTNQ